MTEVWKSVEGYEGLYEVSNMGNVRGLTRTIASKDGKPLTVHGRYLKHLLNEKGYVCVVLSKNNIRKKYKVHRLVAKAFIDNPNGKKEVNHINGDKTDNRPSNLQWVTRSENVTHAYKNGLQPKGQCRGISVVNITDGKTFPSLRSASANYNVDRFLIRNSCETGELTRAGIFAFVS